MLVLISCAKTMTPASGVTIDWHSTPCFERQAFEIALYMSQYPVSELERLLRINSKLGIDNFKRFERFHSEENIPVQAILAYTGIVFKRICPSRFSKEDLLYAQDHLRITSFCYGLLRPLDRIRNYRLEGDVRLPELGGETLFDYWKPLLTDIFIGEIKKQGGVLIYLASNEMKSLFDWKRVENEVEVIAPEFQIEKSGKLSTVVVYTKMARGEMARSIIKNRLETPESLKTFDWEGFGFRPELSDEKKYLFTILQ